MTWELDHVFLATSDAPALELRLTEFGFDFTVRRVHHGQGTANACALFENAFFEILRAHDFAELASAVVSPLGLRERVQWLETGACPIGVCFRSNDAGSDSARWPFPIWPYEAPYVPKGSSIPIVTPQGRLTEPLLFTSPRTHEAMPSPSHRGARRSLTRVVVHRAVTVGCDPPLSAGVRWFVDQGLLSIVDGTATVLELEWDNGGEGQRHEFAPHVPLIVRW